LRNPFRFDIQPRTGTIFINDVGGNPPQPWEEINRGAAGANYGWPVHEGVANDPSYVDPIFAYEHIGDFATTGCAITGGAFYNPATLQFPQEYEGDYFFADFCHWWIRSFDPVTGEASGFATDVNSPIDLEVSKEGELYYLSRGAGLVGKIGYAGT
jgi:glucose/arabinose dehydrogenase